MKPPNEKQAVPLIIDLLADLIGRRANELRVRRAEAAGGPDFIITAPGRRFMAEYKVSAAAGALSATIDQLKRYAQAHADKSLLLIVVSFMGPLGRELCDKEGVSWLDLSGNAKIIAPGLTIRIEGRPNKFSDRGRPPNVFAPKSSRIVRQLLFDPQRLQTQAELARQTGLGDGYVSKSVGRLKQEHYLDANSDGAVRPSDPNLLLDAWNAAYKFNRHRIIAGHVPARSGDELLDKLAKRFARNRLDYAATALAAAWQFTKFAAFRLVTVYLQSMPPRTVLEELEFSDEPKGANLWLVLPDDEGVFQGSQRQDGVQCVSPVQTYLDLKEQPERAKDAASELRRRLLKWGQHET